MIRELINKIRSQEQQKRGTGFYITLQKSASSSRIFVQMANSGIDTGILLLLT